MLKLIEVEFKNDLRIFNRLIGLHPTSPRETTRSTSKSFFDVEKQGIETFHEMLPWLGCA